MSPVKKSQTSNKRRNTKAKAAASKAPVKTSRAKYILSIMFLLAAIAYLISKDVDVEDKVVKKDNSAKTEIKKNENKSDNKNSENKNTESKRISVKLYFAVADENGHLRYEYLTSTAEKKNKYKETLSLLFNGPSKTFEDKGFLSAIPESTKIRSVSVNNGIAVIDLNSDFRINSVGDFLITRLNQIYLTMTQFPEVKGIIIKIEGQRTDTPGVDGRVINWPMTEII